MIGDSNFANSAPKGSLILHEIQAARILKSDSGIIESMNLNEPINH